MGFAGYWARESEPMHFVAHYWWNHRVGDLPERPYFALGVALPDLWSRYSRERRIHWRTVQRFQPPDEWRFDLRAGLLNHIQADKYFHASPSFLRWQHELKAEHREREDIHSAVLDLVTHVALELALDHHLIGQEPSIAAHYYDVLGECDVARVEAQLQPMVRAESTGVGDVVRGFIERRFLSQFGDVEALVGVLELILSLPRVDASAPHDIAATVMRRAVQIANPAAIWREMPRPTGIDAFAATV